MNDPTDDLMQRLAAADPVDRRTIPSAEDPSAQHLMESIVNSDPSNRPISDDRLIDSAGPADGPSEIAAARPSGRGPLRGRGMLVAAAASVLLLVGGLLVFSPDSTPSAVAAVHGAAAAAADADTGRISTTFSLSSDGAADEHIDGRFDASYAGSNVAVSVQVDQQTGQLGAHDLPFTDARLVDGILYVDNGGQWLAVDTEGLLGEMVAGFIDPRVVLETVQRLTDTTEVGSEVVDGVDTTHYRSVVDLGDESLTQSGWMAFEGVPIEADGVVTVDMYVDSTGLLNRLDLSGDVQNPDDSAESGTFEVSMMFFDIGADITVEAPADAETVNSLQGLFGD